MAGPRPAGHLTRRYGRRRWRRLGRTANLAGAVLVSAVLLWGMAAGFGTVPPLGAVLDAGRGAWTSAAGGRAATSQTLRLPGLQHPVSVTYTAQGIASVRASTDPGQPAEPLRPGPIPASGPDAARRGRG